MDDLPAPSPSTPLSVITNELIPIGDTWGVAGNESEGRPLGWRSPPSNLSLEQLQDARWLPLDAVAQSPGAIALVSELVRSV